MFIKKGWEIRLAEALATVATQWHGAKTCPVRGIINQNYDNESFFTYSFCCHNHSGCYYQTSCDESTHHHSSEILFAKYPFADPLLSRLWLYVYAHHAQQLNQTPKISPHDHLLPGWQPGSSQPLRKTREPINDVITFTLIWLADGEPKQSIINPFKQYLSWLK